MMKQLFLLLLCTFSISSGLLAQSQEAIFADEPTISPDGSTIIFTFDKDLWKVASTGGTAVRLTAMEGSETNPSISPDGQWLAFTGSQFGNQDVYLMPIEGGTITQLTFHQAADEVSTWSWDSQTIYFTSNRYNRTTTYRLSAKGGTPQRLFGHYFNNVHNLALAPDGQQAYFNESWESDNFTNRKRYKGAFNPDIKTYNFQTQTYQKLTDYEGKDMWPLTNRQGDLYFVSDEYNGEYNLYQLDGERRNRLTRFSTSVKNPAISADGSQIVFQKDYQIWRYDTQRKRASEVPITIYRNSTLAKTQDFNVSGKITDFDVSDDGKKFCFVSRGELFVSDTEGKLIRQIPTRADGRVLEVHWVKDNATILFSQTVGGYQNWFTISAKAAGPAQQHTSDEANNRNLVFNEDKSQAVYFSGRNEVRLLDLESMASSTLCSAELWGFYNATPQFTPDGKHVLFTAYQNFEQEIYLCHIETKAVTNLTNTAVTETNPFIAPDGKHLYFTTNRTTPSYPYGLDDPDLYRMALQAYDDPYKSEKIEALFAEEEKDSTETEAEKTLDINTEGVMERLERVGARFGSQSGPFVIQEDNKTTLVYSSNHDEGDNALWTTVLEPFEQPVTKKIEGSNNARWYLKTAKKKYYTLARGRIMKVDLSGNKAKAIDMKHTFRRNLRAEFKQMFYETWANLDENFYNENFHGIDWKATRDQYAEYLPYLNTRADLRLLTNDMLGELNTSHFGFYSSGDEEDIFYKTSSLATGIEFDQEDPYLVQRIIRETPASRYQKDIRPGDRLVAVNGQTIDPQQNREWYFAQPSMDEELQLTFQRDEDQHEVLLHPTSYGSVRNALYDEWEDECQRMVDEKSDRRIAYVHMKNMGGGELEKFLEEMVSEGQQREGLILDLRWNTGGNVHDNVLRFLSQKPYLNWKYREGELTSQSNFGPADKPIVLLINEQSLSDAEMTAAGFKELGLGTIIGTETYRWIIFTSGKSLVDGSRYRLPSWGCYTLDGDNLEKTGVAPDIYVPKTFEHRLKGEDPQLERAVQEVMKGLK
ncbi:MAG TPA: S41 family peptidase [Saprospiraceae bacterium]|nr:S41 family peptidase [Saprospiraceae bacterium]